jgi:acyl-coenzyme A thioesterase PaaI-like protein
MARANWIICVTAAILITCATDSAQAQTVTFSRIDDATASRFYDPATTRVDTSNRNRLIIGFNKGLDALTMKYRDFMASTAAFRHPSAIDAFSVRIAAPAGYYIARITYTQRGTGSIVRTGRASGGATWTVADVTSSLGTFSTNPTLTQTIDLRARRLTVVPVSITNSLNAFATSSLGSATVSLTGAEILVQLLRL